MQDKKRKGFVFLKIELKEPHCNFGLDLPINSRTGRRAFSVDQEYHADKD